MFPRVNAFPVCLTYIAPLMKYSAATLFPVSADMSQRAQTLDSEVCETVTSFFIAVCSAKLLNYD